jgi:ubiquinone/menaquinone biosynthesis C-methylase UbiE
VLDEGSLAAALERVGNDGDVLLVLRAADDLDRIRHASNAPNISFLLGDPDVLPLTDASVDFVVGAADGTDVARVLRR